MTTPEPYAVFQVQIRVTKGKAKFERPLPNGLTELSPSQGWVALEPAFSGERAGPKQHLEFLLGQVELLFDLYGRPNQPLATAAKVEAIQLLLKEAAPVLRDLSETDDERTHPNCSLDQAKEAFCRHQQTTIKTLESQGCSARLRLISFRKDEVLQETDRGYGVDILARTRAGRTGSPTIPRMTMPVG